MPVEEWMVVYQYAAEPRSRRADEWTRPADVAPYRLLVDLNSGTFGLAAPADAHSGAPTIIHRATTVPEMQAWLDAQRGLSAETRWVWLGGKLVKSTVAYDMVGQCWKIWDDDAWKSLAHIHEPVRVVSDDDAAEINALYAEHERLNRESHAAFLLFRDRFDATSVAPPPEFASHAPGTL